MSKNWLTLFEPKSPAPVPAASGKKEIAAARDMEFARKVETLRRATGKIEARTIDFACARTGERFFVRFERMNPSEQLKIAALEKAARLGGSGAASAPREQSFACDEFDFTGYRCPYCGDENVVACSSCGGNVCQGRTVALSNGTQLFACRPGCNATGSLAPLKEMRASFAPSALPRFGRSLPSLPGASLPRLPRC